MNQQSNLAAQQPEDLSPQSQVGTTEQDSVAPSNPVLKLGKQKERSPEQQAEIERICRIEPYIGVPRDNDLFTKLNHWRDSGICGRILTVDRMGLAKSLTFYTQTHTKRRSGLLVTPAPVAYAEIEQNGSPIDLFLAILEFLVNPLDCGNLRQLRSRTWGTLKNYKVKILIINNADTLSYTAFRELMRTSEKLKISVVLAGSHYLNDILEPKAVDELKNVKKNKYKSVDIYNTFLKWHPYRTFDRDELKTIISGWEKELGWPQPLNLFLDSDILDVLQERSQGQLRVLYECLREIAMWKLDHSKAQVNFKNIKNALSTGFQPISKLNEV
jgi:hypothetical protein